MLTSGRECVVFGVLGGEVLRTLGWLDVRERGECLQGSGGAFEISQRMTAMLGWGATVDFAEDWTWNQAAETYVLDEEMAALLRANNPEAFKNTVARMLEAAGRGIWNAPDDVLRKLQEQYADLDEQLEKAA